MMGVMPGEEQVERPGTVVAAAFLTWAMAGLVAAIVLLGTLVFWQAGSDLSGAFDGNVGGYLLAAAGTTVAWSVLASVLAWQLWQRRSWARTGLAVSSAAVIALSVVLIYYVVPVVTLLAAVGVLVLMFSGGANDWFRLRPRRSPGKRATPRRRRGRAPGKRAKRRG